MNRRLGLWTAVAIGIAVALWAASAGCAGALGGGDSARIEVVNDLPDVLGGMQVGGGVRVAVQSVDRPEQERYLGTVPQGSTRTFSFGPGVWDRSYRLKAGARTTAPVALAPGVKVRWTLSINMVEVVEPPLEGVALGVPAAGLDEDGAEREATIAR